MPHFFAETDGKSAFLSPEDLFHAQRVLRMREGEVFTFALDGKRYRAAFSASNRYPLSDPLPGTEPTLRLTLFQGIPKGDKLEQIAQKCTEGGLNALVPVAMERCNALWDPGAVRKKQERLQKIIREAAMQSCRSSVPSVSAPVSLKSLDLTGYDAAVFPWEETARAGGRGLKTWWFSQDPPPRSIALIIGPEGGISGEEAAFLTGKGAVPLSLGPRIFRTETAGLAALAALMCLSGNMD